MGTKLYVGNLAYSTTNEDLNEMFGNFGTVTAAQIIDDRSTGRSKGFGFVEMSSDAEAQSAINQLNGSTKDNRTLIVNEARPREFSRDRRFSGGSDRSNHR